MQVNHSISEYVKRWGCSASMGLLAPNCQFFIHPSINGVIGYHLQKNTAVVLGDPVCSPADAPKLADAFHLFCRNESKKYIYLAASHRFAEWAMQRSCQGLLEVEEELIVDPSSYPKTGKNGRLLQKKKNHAFREHVMIKENQNGDAGVKNAIIKTEEAWLQGRQGPQIHLPHANFFEAEVGKRYFYAEQNNQVVGAVLLNQLESQEGWLLYLLLTTSNAPVGTSEFLIMSALDRLAEENCHFFSFGISAAADVGEIVGLNKLSAWMTRKAFKMTKKIFQLDNRRKFWEKFNPQNKRSFILFSKSIGVSEVFAIMKTLNASLSAKSSSYRS